MRSKMGPVRQNRIQRTLAIQTDKFFKNVFSCRHSLLNGVKSMLVSYSRSHILLLIEHAIRR